MKWVRLTIICLLFLLGIIVLIAIKKNHTKPTPPVVNQSTVPEMKTKSYVDCFVDGKLVDCKG